MIHSTQLQGVRLTGREKEILAYLITGLKTKEIAEKLSISEHTVYHHRKSVLRKKGAKSCRLLVAAIYPSAN